MNYTAEQVEWLRILVLSYKEATDGSEVEDPDARFTMLREVETLADVLESCLPAPAPTDAEVARVYQDQIGEPIPF